MRIEAPSHLTPSVLFSNEKLAAQSDPYYRNKTFFYIDPHYLKTPYYKHNLELADYKEMAGILGVIKARFILSINDFQEMREAFKGFNIKPVRLKYSVKKDSWTEGKELLIINF